MGSDSATARLDRLLLLLEGHWGVPWLSYFEVFLPLEKSSKLFIATHWNDLKMRITAASKRRCFQEFIRCFTFSTFCWITVFYQIVLNYSLFYIFYTLTVPTERRHGLQGLLCEPKGIYNLHCNSCSIKCQSVSLVSQVGGDALWGWDGAGGGGDAPKKKGKT